MINVSKPHLPPLDEYVKYLAQIWGNTWITNHGPLVAQLEKKLEEYLGVKHVCFVSSGTMGLDIAIRAAEVTGEVITSAFSYVATINAILATGGKPVLVDIDQTTLCIDPAKIEAAITDKTTAILATHVYGGACEVNKLEKIAKAHHLKIIYDGAHAFDVKIDRRSIFNYGNATAVSFHGTKLFHTVEGGAIITNDDELAAKCRLVRNFGINNNMPEVMGINGKNTEFHAAMGLCNLPRVKEFIAKRKLLSTTYKKLLSPASLEYPRVMPDVDYNYAYFPVIFPSEDALLLVKEELEKKEIFPRRYFYPSFNDLPYYKGNYCEVSENISRRIMCLPLYFDLSVEEVNLIAGIVVKTMNGVYRNLLLTA